MQLLVNTPAVQRSSQGVRRYAASILSHLDWAEGIESVRDNGVINALARLRELLEPGRRDAILWTPCQRGSIRARHHVVTVHDCISIEYTYRNDPRLPLYLKLMELLLRRAEAVVAISQATRAAILRNFSLPAGQIEVIASGVDPIAPKPERWPEPQGLPFVLLVTNELPHKNTLATCRAWVRCRGPREGVELRVVGRLPDSAREICVRAGVPLRLQQGLDDARLAAAYGECRFLVAPSLCEGHDLPVAEALSLGADALCSDIEAHREFYEGKVLFFDPRSEDAIVEAFDHALGLRRPWFPAQTTPPRSFRDVAAEYAALFHRIEARHG